MQAKLSAYIIKGKVKICSTQCGGGVWLFIISLKPVDLWMKRKLIVGATDDYVTNIENQFY